MGFLKSCADSGGILWQPQSLARLSPEGTAAFYPRLCRLQNGTWLLAYASGGNIVTRTSTDAGRTWQAAHTAAVKSNGVNRDTPELLQLQNGTVLLVYASRPQGAMRGKPETGKHFDIRVAQSSDNGATWAFEKVLYQGDTTAANGCWEPAALQLPNGEIQVFFSDETPYKTSNEQNISLLRSADGGSTWSTTPQIVSFRAGSRDGMPVPLWLPHQQQVALAIEDPGYKNFKPYIISSASGGAWGAIVDGRSGSRHYGLLKKLPDSVYAGAPYLQRLSGGQTLLSYQSTEGRAQHRDGDAVMVVAVGDSNAANFCGATTPFAVPEGRHALWNSLCVLPGDTVVALTSTNAFAGKGSEIWMIKGTLRR